MPDLDTLIDVFADRGVEGERPWRPPVGVGPFDDGAYFVGEGSPPLEVCVVVASQKPKRDQSRDLWRTRQGRQASPLLLICAFASSGTVDAHVCGPTDTDLTVHEMGYAQAVGLAASALSEPSGLAAVRFLHDHTPKEGQDFQGLINQGMFAGHTLRGRVRELPGWEAATATGNDLRVREGRALVEALGFTIETSNTPVNVLRAPNDQARAVAIFLDRDESPDSENGRFGNTSALSQAFTRAERDNVPFVLFTRGPEIRLYAATGHHGVGRKGQAETYVQANVSLLADDETGFLPLIFSADALLDGGTFEQILAWSRDFSADLSARLRDRVYADVVPALAVAVAEEHARHDRDAERTLEDIYEETLVILFRLLFLAYGEDRGLLPYATSAEYRRNSLKTIARSLADRANESKGWETVETTSLWTDVNQLFEAINIGNEAWSVPPYNGGLFSPAPDVSPAGAAIDELRLTDERFGPPLTALLTEVGDGAVIGPVDFRSLSVRDFGTIYEGLLESSLSVATTDLALDARENYVPARDGDSVVVAEGSIYFHNRSGARKSSGSYFTKDFAVEHLLEGALEPALTEHLGRLGALLAEGRDDEAGQTFFDFRCADLAMGSGHFLVAAVDHVEKRLAQFLDENPIAVVEAELDLLRAAAVEHLGDGAAAYEIERRQLLRRQVARRCAYGVDRNHLAVELARLSLWVHTFVPGLPLSFLDHNLVQGDALTGVGTVDEAVEYLTEQAAGRKARHGQVSIFEDLIVAWLEEAKAPLIRLARASDATRAELSEVRQAQHEAEQRAEPVRKLFDLVGAMRRGEAEPFTLGVSTEQVLGHVQMEAAERTSRELEALHFPAAFPEVFLRERPGFDCIIGNPPWQEATVEKLAFWALRYPGLRGLPQREQAPALARLEAERPDLSSEFESEQATHELIRSALGGGPYPGMGTGDPDLYKAFCWRFWQLSREGGRVGVVLPRAALSASGSAPWRERVFDEGVFEDVTMLLNRRGWVFDEVHPQFTVSLAVLARGAIDGATVTLRGPYASLAAYREGMGTAAHFAAESFRLWSPGAAFPLLPSPESPTIFEKFLDHPRLGDADRPDGWRARPASELHATADKKHMLLESAGSAGLWRVYKGASFDLCKSDTGTYYAWCEPEYMQDVLQKKRLSAQRNSRSAFSEMPPAWAADMSTLPCNSPRLVVRDITNRTNRRTVIASMVPAQIALTNKAPYFLWPQGDERDQSYLLGVLSSIPLDWYARRIVEINLNFYLLNSLPIPAPPRDDERRVEIERLASGLFAGQAGLEEWAARAGAHIPMSDADDATARLDALAASLFGLQRGDLAHVFETFHEGWDYAARLDRTMAHFEAL